MPNIHSLFALVLSLSASEGNIWLFTCWMSACHLVPERWYEIGLAQLTSDYQRKWKYQRDNDDFQEGNNIYHTISWYYCLFGSIGFWPHGDDETPNIHSLLAQLLRQIYVKCSPCSFHVCLLFGTELWAYSCARLSWPWSYDKFVFQWIY